MKTSLQSLFAVEQRARWAPAVIALGTMILLAGSFWPAMPAVTAMAFIALGATSVTLARLRRAPNLLPMLPLHLATYGILYVVFIGAALHAANARSGPRLEVLAILDIVVSVIPMLVAGRIVWESLRSDGACDA